MLKKLLSVENGAVLAVTVLAGFLRIWQLDATPPGLHYDEAFHALQARAMLETGHIPVFIEGNFGNPPMFAFLVSLSFRVLGQTPLAVRAVSAVVGTLCVPALYLLVREVMSSRRVALLAALLLALSFQGLVYSREGLQAHLVPLFLTLSFYLLWRGWRTGAWTTFALAGLCFALGFYTYQAFWLAPLILAPVVVWLMLTARFGSLTPWRQVLVLVLVAAAVVAPLVPYILSQGAPGNRLGQIAIIGQPGGQSSAVPTLLDNLRVTAAMFTFKGDDDPRNNLPGRPLLDPFLSVAFVVGLGVCLWRWRRPEYGLWLVWLVVMALPVALSDYAPHFRRAIGLLPAVTVIVALGLRGLWQAFSRSRLPGHLRRTVPAAVLAAGLLTSGFVACRDYFVSLGPTNEYFYAFDTGLAQMAWFANTLPADERVYYLPADNRHATLQFLAKRPVPHSFESRRVWVLPPADAHPTTFIAVTMEDPSALPFLKRAYPSGSVVHEGKDYEGGIYFTAYRVPAGATATVTPQRPLTSTLADAVALIGYDVDPVRDGRLAVTVYWRCLRPMNQDYTGFVHLVGTTGLAAQDDMQPGRGSYPTSHWQAGETVIDHFSLDVSRVAAGDYELRAGMYLLATGQRLPALDAGGARLADDAVVITALRL